jgi:hypothetical protein
MSKSKPTEKPTGKKEDNRIKGHIQNSKPKISEKGKYPGVLSGAAPTRIPVVLPTEPEVIPDA